MKEPEKINQYILTSGIIETKGEKNGREEGSTADSESEGRGLDSVVSEIPQEQER